jgi:hypothetical protein
MRRALTFILATAAVAAICAPATARADGFVSPWAAVQFGGRIGDFRDDIDRGRGAFGVTAGAMGAGIIGGEFDFAYSPSFLERRTTSATTHLGNLNFTRLSIGVVIR